MEPSAHPTHPNLVGTLYNQPVYQWDGPCGGMTTKSWILVPHLGIRRLQTDELQKLKGLTDSSYANITDKVLSHSVEQHVWSTLCHAVSIFLCPPAPSPIHHHVPLPTPSSKVTTLRPADEWHWKPPDLNIGSHFYNDRVTSLRAAIDILGPENEHFFVQGLKILESHRNNYGSNPDTLVILWWEWPQLHWPELRMGASMNL